MTIIGEAYVQLKPDEAGFGSAVNNIVHKVFTALGPVGIAAGIGVGITGVLIDVGEKFQEMYNTIARATGATGAALSGLERDARNVFATSIGANFKNVADAISEVSIRTGLTGPPLDKLTKQFVELAHMDPSASVQDLTSVFGQFNVAASDQSRELDVLFKAHQVAGVAIGQLTSDMKTAIPTAQMLGLNMDQTAAMVAQLDKLGLPASKTMLGLASEFAKAAKAGMDPTAVIGALVQEIKAAPNATEAATLAMGKFGLGARQAGTLVEAIRSGVTNFGATLGQITSGKDGIDSTARATATLGDKFKLFKNDALVAIEPVAAKFLDFADKVMSKLPPIFDAIRRAMAPVVAALKDIGDYLGTHRELMIGVLAGIGTVVAAVVVPAFIAWAVAAGTAAIATLTAAAPFIAVGIAVAALATGLVYLIENWDDVWAAIKDTVSGVVDWLKKNWDIILVILTGPLGLAVLVVRRFGGDIERGFDDAFNAVKRVVLGALDEVVGFFTKLPGRALDAAKGLLHTGEDVIGGFLTGVENRFVDVYNWFVGLPGRILDALKDAAKWLIDTGINILVGLYNGMIEGKDRVMRLIGGIPGDIIKGFAGWLGISSPSTIFHGFGLNLMQGLANGITTGKGIPQDALQNLVLRAPSLAALTAGPATAVGATTTTTNAQILALLTQIRVNTDPSHVSASASQTIGLLTKIESNTGKIAFPEKAAQTAWSGTEHFLLSLVR